MKKILAGLLILASVFLFQACSAEQVNTSLQAVERANDSAARVMTFNICYGGVGKTSMRRRAPYLIRDLKRYMPDSIGFQEATGAWVRTLQKELAEYAFVGVGREDGKSSGEYNPIFYRKDKFELLDSGTFWLSETQNVPSKGWDSACNRICTWAVLKNKETGQIYAHYNTHLDNVGKLAQKKGAQLILEHLKRVKYPIILTGDFNANEHSSVYETVTASSLADAKYTAEDTMSSPTFHNYQPERMFGQTPIDFIFLSKKSFHPLKYQVVKDKVDGRFLSDHYAIYVDYVFKA